LRRASPTNASGRWSSPAATPSLATRRTPFPRAPRIVCRLCTRCASTGDAGSLRRRRFRLLSRTAVTPCTSPRTLKAAFKCPFRGGAPTELRPGSATSRPRLSSHAPLARLRRDAQGSRRYALTRGLRKHAARQGSASAVCRLRRHLVAVPVRRVFRPPTADSRNAAPQPLLILAPLHSASSGRCATRSVYAGTRVLLRHVCRSRGCTWRPAEALFLSAVRARRLRRHRWPSSIPRAPR